MQIRPKACHNVVILYIKHDLSIATCTCFLGGGGVAVATILPLYAFDRSYTQPSQDKAGFRYPVARSYPVDMVILRNGFCVLFAEQYRAHLLVFRS